VNIGLLGNAFIANNSCVKESWIF